MVSASEFFAYFRLINLNHESQNQILPDSISVQLLLKLNSKRTDRCIICIHYIFCPQHFDFTYLRLFNCPPNNFLLQDLNSIFPVFFIVKFMFIYNQHPFKTIQEFKLVIIFINHSLL